MFLEFDVWVYSSFYHSGATGFKYSSLRTSLLTVLRVVYVRHCSAFLRQAARHYFYFHNQGKVSGSSNIWLMCVLLSTNPFFLHTGVREDYSNTCGFLACGVIFKVACRPCRQNFISCALTTPPAMQARVWLPSCMTLPSPPQSSCVCAHEQYH